MSRVVLVTGCSTGGIGYALCEEFARQGCTVYATSRKVETIDDFGDAKVKKLALDVTSEEAVQNVIQQIVHNEGKIDMVVNNAGTITPGPLIDQDMDDVKRCFDTNTFAILRVCKAVIPIMAKRKQGTIVNIGSSVGEVPTPWNGIYCATKAAVYSLSEVLSMECRPLGINVMHVSPGTIKSNIINKNGNFSLPRDSLYHPFLPGILERIEASQGPESMPTADFAKGVVSKALQQKPPHYILLGGHSLLFKMFRWLPRFFVLTAMWKKYSKTQ